MVVTTPAINYWPTVQYAARSFGVTLRILPLGARGSPRSGCSGCPT